MKKNIFQIVLTITFLVGITSTAFSQYYTYSDTRQAVETGTAMFYADYLHGQATALQEVYNKYEFTCSHPSHPKGTLLKVTRTDNGKSVVVRVNDRGQFDNGVIISLSRAAAMDIDLVKVGKATVTVELASAADPNRGNYIREKATDQTADFDKNYTDYTANNRSSMPANYDQLTPKGSSGATFKWNQPATSNNTTTKNAPINYNMPPNTTTVNGNFGIQIGSYGVYDNADRQLINLRNTGIDNAFVKESVTATGSKLFRVMVGAFVSREEAQIYLQNLRSQLIADGIIVSLNK